MKIIVKEQNNLDAAKLIKRCGFAEIWDRRTGQTSFVRRLGRYHYPRFHLYIEEDGLQQIIYNLHLDQKKPSYEGAPAHSADYEGEILEKEAERIRNIIAV